MSIYDTDYYKNSKKKTDEAAAADIAQKEKDAAERKEQINATLDQSATAQTGVYEQAIADAPLQSRALYDKNALDEAVNRKKIQETLANMGMTDSGISSSMHTALAVQKSRADNQVRANEYQTIRAYESAIDQILADTEAKKAEAAIEIDQDVADYRLTRKAQAENDAVTTATSLYNADLEAYTARQEQQQKAQELRIKYAQGIQDNRSKLAQQYIDSGMSPDEAWARAYTVYPDSAAWGEAYALYPDTTTIEGVKYDYYNRMIQQGFTHEQAIAMANAYVNAASTAAEGQDAAAAGDAAALTAWGEGLIAEIDDAVNANQNKQTNDTLRNSKLGQKLAGFNDAQLDYLLKNHKEKLAIYESAKNKENLLEKFGIEYGAITEEIDKLKTGIATINAVKEGDIGYVKVYTPMQQVNTDAIDQVVGDLNNSYGKLNMSDAAKKYAVATKAGEAYSNMVVNGDDSNAQLVGEALAKYFDGMYLAVALAAAGLE